MMTRCPKTFGHIAYLSTTTKMDTDENEVVHGNMHAIVSNCSPWTSEILLYLMHIYHHNTHDYISVSTLLRIVHHQNVSSLDSFVVHSHRNLY